MWSVVSGTSWQTLRLWLVLITSVAPGGVAANEDKGTISGALEGNRLVSSLVQ